MQKNINYIHRLIALRTYSVPFLYATPVRDPPQTHIKKNSARNFISPYRTLNQLYVTYLHTTFSCIPSCSVCGYTRSINYSCMYVRLIRFCILLRTSIPTETGCSWLYIQALCVDWIVITYPVTSAQERYSPYFVGIVSLYEKMCGVISIRHMQLITGTGCLHAVRERICVTPVLIFIVALCCPVVYKCLQNTYTGKVPDMYVIRHVCYTVEYRKVW